MQKKIKIVKTKTYKKWSWPWLLSFIGLSLGLLYTAGDWYVCAIYQECKAGTAVAAAPAKQVFNKIHYQNNQSEVFFTSDIDTAYESVGFMDENSSNKKFTIYGNYFRGENSSVGLSRAKEAKKLFASKAWFGQIALEPVFKDKDFKSEKYGEFAQAVYFEITDTSDKYEIRDQTIYFALNASNPKDSFNINNFLKGLAKRYKAGELKSFKIIGHTDNQGRAESNYNLGLSRAEMIAQMLSGYGVSLESIEPSSMGETEPAATNETITGRALNRRVKVITN